MYCTPGPDNSSLINTEKAVPINPENKAKIKYNVPISFAFDDKNHLSTQREISELFLTIQDSRPTILDSFPTI
jgi:hypothetical protein